MIYWRGDRYQWPDPSMDVYMTPLTFFVLLYKKNRFHPVVCLFSNGSQRTSKPGKNISDTLGYGLVCKFFVLIKF